MKKLLVFVFALTLVSVCAYAGDTAGEHGKVKHGGADRLARMQKNIGLSDEQVEQIRTIRENGGGREDILAVMTDEQRAQMRERRSKKQGQGKMGGGHRRGTSSRKGQPNG